MNKKSILIFIGVVGLLSCNSSNSNELSENDSTFKQEAKLKDSIPEKEVKPKDSIYIDSFFTDISKTIAGMSNSFAQKRGLPTNYSKQVDVQYSIFQKNKINPISNWVSERTLIPDKNKCNTLFYPLAGADFAYANAFFKDVDNFILVGLEKPGYLPNYNSFDNAAIENYRSHIFNSLGVSMKSGFFRTNSMRVQFSQKYVNGTLHSLLFYLARSGNQIRKIGHFILKDDASLRPTFGTEAMFSPGLDIEFLTADNKVKHLYYYSFDLSDVNPKIDNFFKWVDSFGEHHTMLKAASYLNSRDYFSKTRNYILSSSNMILQDDSGIPYKYFINGKWTINLFGIYKRVIPLFSSRIQPDMVAAYKDTTKLVTAKLPFGIGYNTAFGETNLQVFYKK